VLPPNTNKNKHRKERAIMATSKKASKQVAKTTPKTDFRLVHEKKIKAGTKTELEGWLGAGQECITDYKSVASRYANASLSATVPASDGKAVSTLHSTDTIRQYVGICVTAIKKEGGVDEVVARLNKEYGYANISDLRVFYSGKGQRGKTVKKKPVKKVETTVVRKKMKQAGVPQRYIDLVMFAIENDKK
jgi:hypothetical protein